MFILIKTWTTLSAQTAINRVNIFILRPKVLARSSFVYNNHCGVYDSATEIISRPSHMHSKISISAKHMPTHGHIGLTV